MSDSDKRKRERLAIVLGENDPKLANEIARTEQDELAWVQSHIGTKVYVETITLNYSGIVTHIFATALREITSVRFKELHRIGEWGRQGVDSNYDQEMTGEHILRWEHITDFGPIMAHWRT